MALEHVTITDPQIHEPKGVSTAQTGTAYIADGAASGNWDVPKISGQDAAVAGDIALSDGLGGVNWITPLLRTRDKIISSNITEQSPVAPDTTLQVKFGPAESNDAVDIQADGSTTFLVAGTYAVEVFGRMGRTSSTGTSDIVIRPLLDGVPFSNTIAATIGNSDTVVPFRITTLLTVEAGTVLTLEVLRDSAGADNGGLIPYIPTREDWAPSSSAALTISRLGV